MEATYITESEKTTKVKITADDIIKFVGSTGLEVTDGAEVYITKSNGDRFYLDEIDREIIVEFKGGKSEDVKHEQLN